MQEQLSRATPGAVAYMDVGKGRKQERKLCRGLVSETQAMHTYRLKGASGKVANQAFGLSAKTVVGRAAGCDLVIDDETIAPRHAEILLNGAGEIELKSLDGNFATHVNGAPVNRAMLSSGDEIRLGNCRWVLQAPGLRPEKVLAGAALEQRRNYLPWLLAGAVLAAAALAWQRGWLVF